MDRDDGRTPHDLVPVFSSPQTTVTVVGSFSPRHSECVVKNVDTGRMLCKGKSAHNETCACIIPTRTAYKGPCTPLVLIIILRKRRRQENLLSPECPGKQVKLEQPYSGDSLSPTPCTLPRSPSPLLHSSCGRRPLLLPVAGEGWRLANPPSSCLGEWQARDH